MFTATFEDLPASVKSALLLLAPDLTDESELQVDQVQPSYFVIHVNEGTWFKVNPRKSEQEDVDVMLALVPEE